MGSRAPPKELEDVLPEFLRIVLADLHSKLGGCSKTLSEATVIQKPDCFLEIHSMIISDEVPIAVAQ